MWQGLQTITDYKGKPSHELPSDASLPDQLNGRFKVSNTEPCICAPAVPDERAKCSLRGKQHWTMHMCTSCSGQLCDHAIQSRCE
jgi:hypothetical protein